MTTINVWASDAGVWRASFESTGDPEQDHLAASAAIAAAITEREEKVGEGWMKAFTRVRSTLGEIVREEPQEGDELVVYRENI